MGIYALIEKKKRDQKRKENIKVAKVASLTAVTGAALGSIMGLLFAPKSGKKTRSDIAEKASETKDRLSEKSAALKETLDSRVCEGKKDIQGAKVKISDYLASKKSKSQEKCADVESAIEEKVEEETIE
ncbi:YtxH domain-containing protein [Clostridium vincentii]|uniref:YtxH-like protein n=1 Tax=Clostridium vincentii TaxID=52704 RepID=A0A2T0BKF8_9CLOT|nr:YtxH domain-containing protein [Clostridium vincentii]PRR84366.1 YtxH-like protein [Clostridium vincentii]